MRGHSAANDHTCDSCSAVSPRVGGFGTTFAYVQTGILEHSYNGTTLTISKKGSGLADIVNPCIQSFMQTKVPLPSSSLLVLELEVARSWR